MIIEKVVDLSMPITEETPVYPGDPKPKIKPAATIDADGYNVSLVSMGSHTGTHVDAPFHFNPKGSKIEEVPLEQFMGEGIIIDVSHKLEREAIVLADVELYEEKLGPDKIVLFHTGWSQYAGDEKYFQHPYIAEEAVRYLLEKGIKVFLIDALNIDPPDGSSFIGHELITAVNGIIGENYTNLDLIDFENPFIITLPLSYQGLDGSSVRAVAVKFR
ncbi:cyclase family protein [Mesobacillus harenae]|uniref:cyclase family protein n=1 Tax=Mesobacillus harenae TaxID=2213203 RepID=UPI00157FFA4D|nr:cyclase family protein [Mesobacillus harenae]